MNKEMKRILTCGVTLVGSIVALSVVLRSFYERNLLKLKKIINKNTKVLNVYTYDYVSGKAGKFKAQDVKAGDITFVYTDRAKNYIAILLNIFAKKSDFEKKSKEEYKQIVNFAKELNRVTKNANMVVYVGSKEEAKKYEKFTKNENYDIKIEVVVDIFAD